MKILISYFSDLVHLKMGLIGACFMAVIIFFVNLDHGWLLAGIASMKQWVYTFLLGGAIIKLLEKSLVMIKNPFLSILMSVLFVSVLTSLLVFLVHNLKGTPEPILSTVPTMVLAPPGFLILAIKFKYGKQKTTTSSDEVVSK